MYGMLNTQFAFWIGFWCSLGSLVGLYVLNRVIKKYERQSFVVILLSFILGLSALLVPLFALLDMKKSIESGKDILTFNSIC
jgi:FtsH-binding integral membrane protein